MNPQSTPIRSMTGFGAAERETPIGRLSVEARSVNNRFLDLSFRLPREFQWMEPRLREVAKRHTQRGKVDIFVRWQPGADAIAPVEIDEAALEAAARRIRAVQERLGDSGALPMDFLLQLPGVASYGGGATADEEVSWPAVSGAVEAALQILDEARRREGDALVADLRPLLAGIEAESARVEGAREEVLLRWRDKFQQRVAEWAAQGRASVDDGRLEAEVLLHAERSDITEELTRLAAHLRKFCSLLDSPPGPVGKDLDFLTQELLREVNTIGSKARDTSILSCVLAMKGAIEKIREQIQNLE